MNKNLFIAIYILVLLSFLSSSVLTIFNNLTGIVNVLIILVTILILGKNKFKNNEFLYWLISSFIIILTVIMNHLLFEASLSGIFNLIFTILIPVLLIVKIQDISDIYNNIFKINNIVISIVVIATVMQFFGVYKINYETRVNGLRWIFENPNSFGIFLVCLLSISLLKNQIKLNIFFIVLIGSIIIFTGTRNCIAVLLMITFLFLIRNRKKIFIILPYIFVIVFLALIFINFETGIILVSNKLNNGTDIRFKIWEYVLQNYIFKSNYHTLFGYGISFGAIEYFGGISPHNSYLMIMGKYGSLGLITLMLFYLKVFFSGNNKFYIFILFISIAFYAMFESSMFNGPNPEWIVFILCIEYLKNLSDKGFA